MKLDSKKTILIGFAFLSICSFWQLYNTAVPLILTKTFSMNETWSGAIMAADNVLALFLLPLFGAISDRCTCKSGRRMPFITFGTIAAVVLMIFLPILDNSYASGPDTFKLVLFIIVLGLLLITMGTYRSPAVALMPDVTPKPFRSKANAIINLMGAVGGILYLVISSVLYSKSRIGGLTHVDYTWAFVIVAAIMIISLIILRTTINEPKLASKMHEYEEAHPEENLTVVDENGEEKLPKEVKKSLIFLLLSVAFWFIGYNAIETWFSTYATTEWNMVYGGATLCLTIATAGAIISYIPIGELASRIGRKKTIMAGVLLLAACFVVCYIWTLTVDRFSPILYVLFALVGLAWAAINVNSLPMVVEMCKGSDIGKFTGYYYTFSMAAQIITPIVAGALMRNVGYGTLFPYAAVAVIISFITMIFVKHGDTKVISKKGLEAFEEMD